jgi:drug/metabolite transporter (DMT)-like permease
MARSRRLYVYAVPYVIIASLQYSFAKDGLRFADPLTFMAARYLIASFATFLFARSFRLRVNRDTVLLSFFTAMSTLLWIYGLQRVSPAQSAVLSFTMPLFAIPITAFVLNERASRLGWAGTLLGFVGVTVYGLSLAGSGTTLLGGLLTVGNAVFWASYTVYYRKTRNQDAAATVGTQLLVCGALFAVFAPVTFSVSVTPEFVLDLGYISIFSGFASFLLWSSMLRQERVGKVTTLAFAVPAMTTLIEAIETGVIPDLTTLGGIGVIFLGIYISSITTPIATRTGPEVRAEPRPTAPPPKSNPPTATKSAGRVDSNATTEDP